MKSIGTGMVGLALAACTPINGSDASGDKGTTEQAAETENAMPVEPIGDIGDGIERPMLQPMSYQEFSGPIEAGAGCSFKTEFDRSPLFVATSEDVADKHGRAAIKLNDTIVVLAHSGMGLTQLEQGGVFTTDALEITIEHPGGEPTSEGEETYFWPATLKILQDEGGTNMYEGKYECGA
ncbi:hypothetical protein [Parasphingorhabdus halotolerans]|uniref:Lipoprotein n=1 Tax=Parasphingorhabdus halotolerans TaxID=2725558 RepID=A0A6H2DJU2_9SPHN|nr:hypothetical protein [Parasphingorhabdus halotolerans]QJB68407.1 hypothetical protein HF685_03055 [Parasphingorhabdus halotolerans]